MPQYYILRGHGRVRGPMDRSSADALIAEGTVDADFEVAEVSPGDGTWERTFGPLRDHALWRERNGHKPAPTALATMGRTTEPPEPSAVLDVVTHDALVDAEALARDAPAAFAAARRAAIGALEDEARALGGAGVAAIAVSFCEVTAADGAVVVCSAVGTAVAG